MTVNNDGTVLFLETPSGVRVYNLPQSTGVASNLGVTGFPSLIASGGTGSFTVTALDPINSVVTTYAGTIQLSSPDPSAVFIDPATGQPLLDNQYTFQPGDQGVKTFQAILSTPGPQSITATDIVTGVTGSQNNIGVHGVPVTDIPVANHRDLVYDRFRNYLYITTASGDIQRYDVTNQALLTPFHVSGALEGADITPDGQYLYLADPNAGPTNGFVRKVNLDTGAVTTLTYASTQGAYSIVVDANGKAFVTLAGGSFTPIYQIDLATDTTSPRGSNFYGNTFAARGADRSLDIFAQTPSNGAFSTYDPATDTLSSTVNLNDYLSSTSAVNRDGSLIAVEIRGNVRIIDRNAQTVHTLTGLAGGVAFDPLSDVLYAVDTTADQIDAYDTHSWTPLFTIPIGEAVQQATAYGNGMMTVSADGSLLFLATASGVRIYPLNGLVGTSTTLSANTGSGSNVGQPVTFTATVRGGNLADRVGEPVTFTEGSVILATGTLDASGRATFTTADLTLGSHTISATYAGDASYNYSGASISNFRVVEARIPTTLTITQVTPPGGSHYLENVTFEVSLTGGDPADRANETVSLWLSTGGPVAFGGLDASGHATIRRVQLNLGTNQVSIRYLGDSRYLPSSNGLNYTVSFPTVTLTFFSGPSGNGILGQPTTFDVTVGNWSPPATGSETVTIRDGSTILATPTINSSNHAVFTTSALALGGHTFTATYDGDSRYVGSMGTLDLTVVRPNTVVSLTASPSGPVLTNQPVTFTATVTGGDLASRVGEVVTFRDGTTTLGTGTLDASGQASYTVPSLTAGSHVITAVYGGDTTSHGGTGSLVETASAMIRAATMARLDQSPPSAFQKAGTPLTFTATISGGQVPLRAGEMVTFLDRNLVLGTGTLDTNGQATFTTSSLPVGVDTISAVYAGDAISTDSSASLNVTIVPAFPILTQTTLSASPASSTVGQTVTFTASVGFEMRPVNPSMFSVTFRDGDRVLGTAPLDINARAILTISTLGLGGHTITATFNGDSTYQGSIGEVFYHVSSAGTLATALALAADTPSPAPTGVPITFTATLTEAIPGASQGETVTFLDGQTVLGTGTLDGNGQATFTTADLVAGVHQISVVYDGDANNLGSSTALGYTVVLAG
jgi:hypothetical protein